MKLDDLELSPEDRAALDALAKKTGRAPEQILREAFFLFSRCYNTMCETGLVAPTNEPRAAAAAV